MANFYVLRDCFVGDRYYHAGSVHDLPPDLEKSPKNFRAVNEMVAPIIPPEPVKATQQAPDPLQVEAEQWFEKTLAVKKLAPVPSVTTTDPPLDWDNAEVYVSDKDKKPTTKKNKKK